MLSVVKLSIMNHSPRLIRDGTGRHKIKVSLPGGRYQLSLDDRAVNVLQNDLGRDVGETVPEAFVPFFVAFGDAWFPHNKSTSEIVNDLSAGDGLPTSEYGTLITYIKETRIPRKNKAHAVNALEQSPIASTVSKDDLQFKDIPELPDGIFDSMEDTEPPRSDQQKDTTLDKETEKPPETDTVNSPVESPVRDTSLVEEFLQLPGIGPQRSQAIVKSGIKSLEELANARPVELSQTSGLTKETAAVAIEGAREEIGDVLPAPERLANQTGREEDTFDTALSALAAAGIPATEAEKTLRELYGPNITVVDAVTKQQAYFLWEAGYRTPFDLVEASADELQEIYGVGSTSASEIQSDAKKELQKLKSP